METNFWTLMRKQASLPVTWGTRTSKCNQRGSGHPGFTPSIKVWLMLHTSTVALVSVSEGISDTLPGAGPLGSSTGQVGHDQVLSFLVGLCTCSLPGSKRDGSSQCEVFESSWWSTWLSWGSLFSDPPWRAKARINGCKSLWADNLFFVLHSIGLWAS